MTVEAIREAVHRKPFMPFNISLADGRQVYVRSPEYLFLLPKSPRTIIVAGDRESAFTIIDLLLVISLDFVGQTNGKNGNPRRSRRK